MKRSWVALLSRLAAGFLALTTASMGHAEDLGDGARLDAALKERVELLRPGGQLDDVGALLDLLEGQTHVRHLFAGHVHRPVCAIARGLPLATMKSVLFQAPAPWRA